MEQHRVRFRRARNCLGSGLKSGRVNLRGEQAIAAAPDPYRSCNEECPNRLGDRVVADGRQGLGQVSVTESAVVALATDIERSQAVRLAICRRTRGQHACVVRSPYRQGEVRRREWVVVALKKV